MRDWGWRGVSLFAVLITLATLVTFLVILPVGGVDTTPASDDVNIKTVPASGVGGFQVAEFCADTATKVRGPIAAPDASGNTYELLRVRSSITETVIIVMGPDGNTRVATHYFDTVGGQASEPATVSEAARDCINRKAR